MLDVTALIRHVKKDLRMRIGIIEACHERFARPLLITVV
jgi:hypothetical protein